MKEHERIFFALCYRLGKRGRGKRIWPDEIINALSDTIPPKRCWYYLKKWSDLGFYDWGVSLGGGWFYDEKLPARYAEIVNLVDKPVDNCPAPEETESPGSCYPGGCGACPIAGSCANNGRYAEAMPAPCEPVDAPETEDLPDWLRGTVRPGSVVLDG